MVGTGLTNVGLTYTDLLRSGSSPCNSACRRTDRQTDGQEQEVCGIEERGGGTDGLTTPRVTHSAASGLKLSSLTVLASVPRVSGVEEEMKLQHHTLF